MDILFRFDASPEVGAGHAMRCLAAAEIFADAGWRPRFVVNPEAPRAAPALAASGLPLDAADADGGVPRRLLGPDTAAVVFDHYGLGALHERSVAAPERLVVAFDDLAERDVAADIVVNPTPGLGPRAYAGRVGPDCRLLLGAEHAMVRRSWLARRAASCRRQSVGGPVRRIVVTIGATDPDNVTGHVVGALARLDAAARIHIILGAAAPHRAAVGAALAPNMTLHVDPANLVDLVAGADLAIGAAGSSSFERAVLGLPSLLIQTADNQRRIAATFAAAGAAEIVSAAAARDPAHLAARIAALAGDADRRRRMAVVAARLTDGQGALRLLAALTATAAHRTTGGRACG